MDEYERSVLLERVEREGSTIGADIPTSVTVEDEEYRVRDVVLDLTAADSLTEDQRKAAGELARALRRARRERKQRLERGEIDFETGERLVDEIAGIDRALNAVTRLDAPGVAELARQRERADSERWMQFLREALGHEDGRNR